MRCLTCAFTLSTACTIMFKARSRSGSMDLRENPNIRGRSRSFIHPPHTPGNEDSPTTSSVSTSTNPSPLGTPSVSPRTIIANATSTTLEQQATNVLRWLCVHPKLCGAVLEYELGDTALQALVLVLAKSKGLLALIRDQVIVFVQ
jgi:hypothetical protein